MAQYLWVRRLASRASGKVVQLQGVTTVENDERRAAARAERAARREARAAQGKPEQKSRKIPLPDGQDARVAQAGAGESITSVIAAVAANVAIGVFKFVVAGFTHSSALVSEGIHSLVDAGNDALILLGIKRSERPADAEHPFGYGQELYFWTLMVAILIFALGGGFSIYEGISHIRHVEPGATVGSPWLNYVVLAISAAIEGFSFSVAFKSFNAARGNTPALQFIREAKDPSLFTVLIEDTAAELGLIIAFLGTLVGHITQNPYVDGIAAVVIGLLLAGVAILLLRESKGLLIGEGLKLDEIREVERIVKANPRVIECGRILTLYMGPTDLLVNLDVSFEHDATRDDIVQAIDEIEAEVVKRFPATTRIFIESESLRHTREGARGRGGA